MFILIIIKLLKFEGYLKKKLIHRIDKINNY